MQRNGLNELTNNVVGHPAGEVSNNFRAINESLNEFGRIINDIDDLVFTPRPAVPEKDARCDEGEVATVNQRLNDIHIRIRRFNEMAAEIRDALGSQLDSETRLV